MRREVERENAGRRYESNQVFPELGSRGESRRGIRDDPTYPNNKVIWPPARWITYEMATCLSQSANGASNPADCPALPTNHRCE